MANFRGDREAFGGPGDTPPWPAGDKDGIGTAYAASSRVWYTLWRGIVTEVFFPTVDRPQVRELQVFVTDGKSFVHEEGPDLNSRVEQLSDSLGYRVISDAPEGKYRLVKEVIADPHLPCVLQQIRLEGDPGILDSLKLYIYCQPRLELESRNNGCVLEAAGHQLLGAERSGRWLAIAAANRFGRCSAGYAGQSDGRADLKNFCVDWEFDRAPDGNVGLCGELVLDEKHEVTVALALGDCMQNVVTTALQSLDADFARQRERFLDQWKRTMEDREPLDERAGDEGRLFRTSYRVLLSHEDKTYQGAMVASLSIPWGGSLEGEDGQSGYHLVWTRDLVQCALGLMAAGQVETPRRALLYLAACQNQDGSFAQNFWINGKPHWTSVQWDEIAFPIILARHLATANVLGHFVPREMGVRAIQFLVGQGPVTGQERWEEMSGYSPSTLAVVISAMLCAAAFNHERGMDDIAAFLEAYADWLREGLFEWCVTTKGSLVEGVPRHFIRILPFPQGEAALPGAADTATITLGQQAPGAPTEFPAREVVDAGFLELVRYGVMRADDPLIVDSVRVIDAVLKADTPEGPSWRRYNHDGYGQRADGSDYDGFGQGRAWPLLTGERGHYELAAGRDPAPYLRAMECFANEGGMLTEQIWDAGDLDGSGMRRGRPTGAAMPLAWAHAEYIRLLRSARDGRVFDLLPEVASRYGGPEVPPAQYTMWTLRHPTPVVRPGRTLRIIALEPFRLRWTADEWQTYQDAEAEGFLQVRFVDLDAANLQFTFFWTGRNEWEGRNFTVTLSSS